MKFLFLILFLVSPAFAQTPAYMKGAKITVTLPTGESYSYNRDDYKVVKVVKKPTPAKPVTKSVVKPIKTAEKKRK